MTRMGLSSFLRFLPFYALWGSLAAFRLVFAQQTQNAVLNSGVDAFIDQLLTDWNSPGGVGVAVARRDANTGAWNVETKGYGIAKANGSRVTENTLFAIGSNTKVGDALLMVPNTQVHEGIIPNSFLRPWPQGYSSITRRFRRAYPGPPKCTRLCQSGACRIPLLPSKPPLST